MAARVPVVHFATDDLERVVADREVVRPADRHALRGAVRAAPRLAEAHVGEIILPDGQNLNQELVRAGLAWWYRQCARRESVLRDLEPERREAKLDLWTDPKPVAPWAWRKAAAAARE